jgi:hypothetical protein
VARNQLLENQYREADTIRQLYPGIDERVLAMMCGGFECAAYPNRLLTWVGVEGCCIGGGLRSLYLAWRAGITNQADVTYVNLGFSRATSQVEVIGYEPWQGRVDVRVMTPRRVLIRLPTHTPVSQVHTMVDGVEQPVAWSGQYAQVERLQPGQVATLTYPLPEFRRSYTIAGQHYEGDWRGHTMIQIRPAGEGYAIYQRQGLLAEEGLLSQRLPWQMKAPPVPYLW